eukprot:CAMPEP_0115352066 /NCGR_PEP_ID=MMETSP0270-20121206/97313_1 /TAXON_ID=71861 /ORGANISM="Scrippsiella trochoidea, Strain CCMP3099" /LENGTH=169 /DNA_ID=CAMNT_0002774225 /DNA_START=27 /DNA_END=533 /DNA_ORIENTATION=+
MPASPANATDEAGHDGAASDVAVLSLAVGSSGVDAIYGGYFGLMAFVSGLLDLNLAIEHIVWIEWKQLKSDTLHKGDFSGLVKPSMYLVCAFLQLGSAFVAYMIYKEAETFEDWLDAQDETVPFFATQDQARVYSAALAPRTSCRERSQRRRLPAGGHRAAWGERIDAL